MEENADNVRIRDTAATECTAYNHGGFLHSVVSNHHLSIKECSFAKNKASNNGGVFYMHGTTDFAEIVSSRFFGNMATHGAGINLNVNNNYMNISNCDFANNR